MYANQCRNPYYKDEDSYFKTSFMKSLPSVPQDGTKADPGWHKDPHLHAFDSTLNKPHDPEEISLWGAEMDSLSTSEFAKRFNNWERKKYGENKASESRPVSSGRQKKPLQDPDENGENGYDWKQRLREYFGSRYSMTAPLANKKPKPEKSEVEIYNEKRPEAMEKRDVETKEFFRKAVLNLNAREAQAREVARRQAAKK